MKMNPRRHKGLKDDDRKMAPPKPERARGDRPAGTLFRLGHCRELLDEVLAAPATPADLIISRFFAKRRYLGSHDRGYIADTVYGTLRAVLRLRFILQEMEGEDDAGRLIAACLMERGERADESALREALGLHGREIASIAAAVEAAPARIAALDEPQRTAVRFGFPMWFAARVIGQMGGAEGELLLASLGEQAPVTLRANTLVAGRDRLAEALAARDVVTVPGSHAPDALLLARRMNANAIPEFKLGWFELQDEGSQLLSLLLDPHPNWKVFDACAGAGGKTLHMAAIMRGRGAIIAHDLNGRRLMEIRPRLRRSGAQNVRVMEHERYLEQRKSLAGAFDAVMIDAPCSGAGVLRRTPGARLTFEEEMVDRLVVQQREILEEYAALVKPGGLLLYATCSLLREENEMQVERFLAEHPSWSIRPLPAPPDMITSRGFFRCFPHRHGTDAFFGALLQRG